ncbi:hypothetical protein Tco_0783872 [Tanacetum coccineum]
MEKSDHYAMPNRWDDLLIDMTSMRHNKSIKSVLRRIVFAACVYFIWNERNTRLFINDKKNNNELVFEVVNHIRLKLASLTVKRACQTVEIYKKWKVDLNVKIRYGEDGWFYLRVGVPLPVMPILVMGNVAGKPLDGGKWKEGSIEMAREQGGFGTVQLFDRCKIHGFNPPRP